MKEVHHNDKWFCGECTALLGVRQGDEIQVRFKQEINLTVRGRIIMTCRRCGAINRMETEQQPRE